MTRIQPVSVPRNAVTNGNYHIIVTTDSGNTLNEGTNTSNNTFVAPDLVQVTRTPLPDLVLESVEAPGMAFTGQPITVRWTVRNIGRASTDAGQWSRLEGYLADGVIEIDNNWCEGAIRGCRTI